MDFRSNDARSGDRPPGPDGLPVLGNTRRFFRETPGFYGDMTEEYGDVVSLSLLGFGDVCLVTHPDDLEAIFLDRESFGPPDSLTAMFDDLFGDGIVTSTGDRWRRQRTLMQPAFHRDRIEDYGPVITKHADRTVSRLESGTPFDVEEEMKSLTLRILVEAMFGTDVDYDNRRLRKMAEYIEMPGKPENASKARLVPKWVPIPMWRRYQRGIEHFEDIIYDLVDRRRASTEDRDDLLSWFLAARDEGRMPDDVLRDQMMTMLMAGHETTALTLTCALSLLADQPDVLDRLQAELDDVLDGSTPTFEDLSELSYTEKTVKETLRLYPPAPVHPREPLRDVEIGGYTVPEGTFVMMPAWSIHRDDRFYERPDEFRPSRWDSESDRHSFAFCPFGGGPRQCIGRHFAMVEAQLVLATLAQAYDFETVSDDSLEVGAILVLILESDVELVPRA